MPLLQAQSTLPLVYWLGASYSAALGLWLTEDGGEIGAGEVSNEAPFGKSVRLIATLQPTASSVLAPLPPAIPNTRPRRLLPAHSALHLELPGRLVGHQLQLHCSKQQLGLCAVHWCHALGQPTHNKQQRRHAQLQHVQHQRHRRLEPVSRLCW